MTAVNSAVKMVGQFRRWLTGDDVTGDSNRSAENDTCTCNSSELQYRGRSFSDCYATSCRSTRRDEDVRERSSSVSSRRTSSYRLGSQTYQTSSGTAWSSSRQFHVLEEDKELCHCSAGVEPVCCCERCFVYVDERPSLLPPPYSELMLLERCADLAKRLIDSEPSITVNTADNVTDEVALCAETAATCPPSSAEISRPASRPSVVTSKDSEALLTLSSNCLPPSVHVSLDGEEGYAESQQHLRWARRQRLLDDALTTTSCPPPNRTICHVVDCW